MTTRSSKVVLVAAGAAAIALAMIVVLFSTGSPELMLGGPLRSMFTYAPSPKLIVLKGRIAPEDQARFSAAVDIIAVSHQLSFHDELTTSRTYLAKNYVALDAASGDEAFVQLTKDATDKNAYAEFVADIERTFVPFGLHRVTQ